MGKAEYYVKIKNMVTVVFVCSADTGEILHEFSGLDLLLGEQYWTAWCVGHYYTIVEVAKKFTFPNQLTEVIYWVK